MHRVAARRLPPHHILAAAALAALNGGVMAQQATDSEAGKVQTITVTAERRVENVQSIPNSVSVVPSELLTCSTPAARTCACSPAACPA